MRSQKVIAINLLVALMSCTANESDLTNGADQKIETEGSIETDSYWIENKIDHANVYLYFPELIGDHQGSIVEDGEIHITVFDSLTKSLDPILIEELQQKLAHPTDNLNVPADCYQPHHGIIYYNDLDEIIGSTSICVMCNQIRGDGNYIGMEYYKELLNKLELPFDENHEPNPESLMNIYSRRVANILRKDGYKFEVLE
jgi:hypothetical protein